MLNDPDELKYGVDRITAWFDEQGNALSGSAGIHVVLRAVIADLAEWILLNPAYVVCASTNRDSLGQWRGYAGSGGYAVELDAGYEYAISGRPDPDTTFSLVPTWVKVAYKRADQDALIQSVFEYILDGKTAVGRLAGTSDAHSTEILVRALLSGLAAALKHPSFSDEAEVRLIAFLPHGLSPEFRGSARGVIPYIKLSTAVFPNLSHPLRAFPLPVKSVRIGPPRGEAMDQRIRGVRILLDSTGRSGVPVNPSEIPFIP
ncbi:hypothetical protein B0I08_11033 [Glaciihabitans tibetensis]|uniref:DUF2971 domain-containing protein n=1 Tax=Glaciihabitans tibetensis TaxID=1266600 RepID=A0A2T0V5F7_9MICO|nr:DUF2971 domain-containing protein [Glaciihabitans tibetensis]PRY65401.1 hypothetical protein B0I08_11033 [Glaciihabitans tibetensis]